MNIKKTAFKYQGRKNSMVSLFVISVAVVLALCLYTGMEMSNFSESFYQETEYRLLTVSRYAAELVTARELDELQTPEDLNKPIFNDLRQRMVTFADENNILFVYYMRNTDENLAQYILDNDLTEETVDLTTEPFEWEEKALVALHDRVAAAEVYQYLIGYEHLISGFAPVFDADGQVAAVVGVDILDEQLIEIHNTMNILIPLLAFGVLIVFVCGSLNVFMYNRADEDRMKLSAEVEKGDIDPLVGIYNRRFFDKRINRLLDSLSRSGSLLGLLMIDVDFFKEYNDTYGHLRGDNCLRLVAENLRKGIRREDDFVARYGGDEFVAVLPNTDETGTREVADRFLENVRNLNIPHEASAVAKRVTVSIGLVSVKVENGDGWDDYIKRADEALYLSKQNGRDRCSYLNFTDTGSLHNADS
ncbi:MAG: GGDEF domain-containing protein [Clostridiales bacterium]|nr:GGDEF domain-containing protein [Clostridiales bacterium]